jgi:hypothetical protein
MRPYATSFTETGDSEKLRAGIRIRAWILGFLANPHFAAEVYVKITNFFKGCT